MDNYRNFINGEWVESSSSKVVKNINPANTDEVLGSVKQATREEAQSKSMNANLFGAAPAAVAGGRG